MSYWTSVGIRPLKGFEPYTTGFVNPEYGLDIAQDAGFTGTPLEIYDGGDSTYWTASVITGANFVLSSAAQKHSGSYSFLMQKQANVGDIAQFAKPGGGQDLSSLSVVTMWVYVGSLWRSGSSISLYGYDSGGQVGDAVFIEDYTNTNLIGDWQQIAIPLTAMGLESATIDSFRLEVAAKDVQMPTLYIDDWQIQEGTGQLVYTLEPPPGTLMYLQYYRVIMVDDGDYGPGKLSRKGFLGLGTQNPGLTYQRISNGEILFSAVGTDMEAFFQHPGSKKILHEYDGVETWLIMEVRYAQPIVMYGDEDDRIQFSISTDWSGLNQFRVVANSLLRHL